MLKIKSFLQCIFFLCLLINSKIYTQPFATETILIAIDDSEPSEYGGQLTRGGQLKKNEGLGASGTDLVTALYEEECIIIVSSSIVNYVMRYFKEVSYNPFYLDPAPKIKPQNWIKKKITDYLYILIPKNYPNSRQNYSSAQGVSSKYTQAELATGIIFASKKDIDDKDFMSGSYHKKNTAYPKKWVLDKVGSSEAEVLDSWISDHFIQNLNTIFVPKKEYVHQENAPKIALLLEGHGSKYVSIDDRIAMLAPDSYDSDIKNEISRLQALKNKGKQTYAAGQIAGLNGQDFARLITYFQNNVSIALLFISTCFGSTINLQEALKDIISETSYFQSKQTISFPMISGSIASATTEGGVQIGIKLTKNNDEIAYLKLPRYKKFLETLNTNAETLDTRFFKALEYIYPFYQKYESFNNIPVIKYPGEPWRALELPKIIVQINTPLLETALKNNKNILDIASLFFEKKLAKTTTGFRPPDISDYFSYKGDYPNVLLFSTSEIPAELVFSDTKKIQFPFFFSNIPGDAIHHISTITAPSYTLSDLLDAFLKIEDLQENKTFIIDQAIVKNNIGVISSELGSPTSFQHIIIQNKATPKNPYMPSRKSVYFESNGKEWAAENISSVTPLAFALKEVKAGTTKAIISALPDGLKKYYPTINTLSSESLKKSVPQNPAIINDFARALKNIGSKQR